MISTERYENKIFEVKWTGRYPCLCFGMWEVKYDGKTLELPEDVRDKSMNTSGTYRTWHFDEDGLEEYEYYTDGLEFDEWVGDNPWVTKWFIDNQIPLNELEKFYNAVQEQDFRSGSCGGCI